MSKRHCGEFANIEQLIILGSSVLTPKRKERYIREKIRLLWDFKIPVTEEDKKYLNSLTTEKEIDHAVGRIIKTRL